MESDGERGDDEKDEEAWMKLEECYTESDCDADRMNQDTVKRSCTYCILRIATLRCTLYQRRSD